MPFDGLGSFYAAVQSSHANSGIAVIPNHQNQPDRQRSSQSMQWDNEGHAAVARPACTPERQRIAGSLEYVHVVFRDRISSIELPPTVPLSVVSNYGGPAKITRM